MTVADEPFEVADSSGLTDADWAEINRLRRIYARDGKAALSNALAELATDPIRYMHIMGAIFPDMVREIISDGMAEIGITEEDLRELIRSSKVPLQINNIDGGTRSRISGVNGACSRKAAALNQSSGAEDALISNEL